MEKELDIIQMVTDILVLMLIILEMVKDITFFLMEILMKEIGLMGKQMEKENLLLKMVMVIF